MLRLVIVALLVSQSMSEPAFRRPDNPVQKIEFYYSSNQQPYVSHTDDYGEKPLPDLYEGENPYDLNLERVY